MISSLTGTINIKKDQAVEILVNNIGFWVTVPRHLLTELETGQRTTIYTNLIVREKLMELYGFSSRRDVDTFEMLTSVAGVGPKTAIQIFNQNTSADIRQAIEEADVDFFKSIKGIGRKTAQRLIIDLRSNLDRLRLKEKQSQQEKEPLVYGALRQLGFSNQEIDLVVPKLNKKNSDEEKVSQALKLISGDER